MFAEVMSQSKISTIWSLDDDYIQLEVVRSMVKYQMPEVSFKTFDKSKELVDLFRSGVYPDLLFLDIRMPEINGLEVLELIQDLQVPSLVIMLTSSANPADREKCEQYSFVKGYEQKPLHPNVLKQLAEL